jgi:arylsulfatase A
MPFAGKGKAKMKVIADTPPNMHIALYNLKDDPGETTDVSAQHPDVVTKIEKLMREQHAPNPDFPFPALDNR